MTELEIKEMIEQGLDCRSVVVTGDGHHFEAVIISELFEQKRLVARQQMVYATVNDKIASGELHALSLKTITPDEANASS